MPVQSNNVSEGFSEKFTYCQRLNTDFEPVLVHGREEVRYTYLPKDRWNNYLDGKDNLEDVLSKVDF